MNPANQATSSSTPNPLATGEVYTRSVRVLARTLGQQTSQAVIPAAPVRVAYRPRSSLVSRTNALNRKRASAKKSGSRKPAASSSNASSGIVAATPAPSTSAAASGTVPVQIPKKVKKTKKGKRSSKKSTKKSGSSAVSSSNRIVVAVIPAPSSTASSSASSSASPVASSSVQGPSSPSSPQQAAKKTRKRGSASKSSQKLASSSSPTSPQQPAVKKSRAQAAASSSCSSSSGTVSKTDQASSEYYGIKSLEFAFMEKSQKTSLNCKRLIKNLMKKYKEEGCFEHTISLAARFPDEDNYRLLADFVNENIIPPPSTTVPEAKNHTHRTPALRLTGPTSVNSLTISGAEIIELAKDFIKTGKNFFYDEKHSAKMPDEDTIIEAEKQFFREHGCQAVETMKGRIPVRRIELHSGFDVKELERLIKTSPFLVIGNIEETFEIDFSKFDLAEILKVIPTANIEVLRQRPQPTTENVKMHGTTSTWETAMIKEEVEIKTFTKNIEEIQDIAREGLRQLNADLHQHKKILTDLETKLKEAQLPFLQKGRKDFPVLSFGTNIDLVSSKTANFKEQLEEISKLPDFLLPQGTSTLLHLSGEDIPGINQPQVYVKAPGSRTAAHLENQLIGSININLGPGKCVWLVVPMEYSGKLEALLRKKGLHPYNTMFWPNEDELIKAGIPIMKFEQREGDCVYVGTGSYHWVQANGFATNLSWNVFQAEKFQLAAALLSHDHNAKEKYETQLPLVPLIWRIAREKKFLDTDLYPLIKSVLCRSLAKAQFEMSLAESLNFEFKKVEENKEIIEIMRCFKDSCKRNVLFNMVVTDETREGTAARCIDCSKKDTTTSVVYIRYSTEELVQIFDDYTQD